MLKRFAVLAAFGMLVFGGLAARPAVGQYGNLVARVPDGVNTIVALNVQDILSSPLAQEQNWRAQQEKATEAGLSMVPPNADYFLMASQMDYEFMHPIWEVAMANLKYEASMPRVAARWGGEIDRISNRTAVRLPTDAYVVQFGSNLVGAYRPGNRQSIARWLSATDTFENRLTPYLKESLDFSQKGRTPIIMAMDLSNVLSEDLITSRMEGMKSLEGVDVNKEQLAKAMASIQGVTLGITIRDKIYGAIKVDFAEDVSFMEPFAKALVLEILSNQGAMIDEFKSWNVKAEGKEIKIGGTLQRSGMQRIMSIMEVPASLQSYAGSDSVPEVSEEDLARLASQQYFKSVSSLLDDLKKDSPDFKNLSQIGTWLNRYATKIDKLEILNVDPELVDYGRYVSSSMRAASTALKSSAGRARTRSLNVSSSYTPYGRWGTNGYYAGYAQDVRALQQDRTQIRTEERISAATDARSIMQEVTEATADIRVKMTQKYQANF